MQDDAKTKNAPPVRVQPVVRPRAIRTTFVVQYKSIYNPKGWMDDQSQHTFFRQIDAEDGATGIRSINPNVRVIKRTVIEEEVA